MENNNMDLKFEDFGTDLTEVRKNLFALNLEIHELTKKINEIWNFVDNARGAIILHGLESIEKSVKYYNSPEYLSGVESDSDGDALVSMLCCNEKMQD